MGRHRARFAASLLASCFPVMAIAQTVLPDSPADHRLAPPALAELADRNGFRSWDSVSTSAPPVALWSKTPGGRPPSVMHKDSVSTRYRASSYVAIDSWVYPVVDRLIALGYIQTGSSTIRPFTRIECARLVAEAHILAVDGDPLAGESDVGMMLLDLDREFAHELRVTDGADSKGGVVERVYARYNGIAGAPLRDSFHFGQTVYDDFGRPYGQGGNAIVGFAAFAEAGPLAVYGRAEYQHAGSSPTYSASATQAILDYDRINESWQLAAGAATPPIFNFNPAPVSRVRLVEGYAAVNLANWQFSAGQQSLWWGPNRTTSLILSNNAAAMPMIRVARAKPAQLPGVFSHLGPFRIDAFLARQGGIHYVALGPTFVLFGSPQKALTPPPYIWGLSMSVEPTKNLEFTFAHTVIFAGYGRPLNLRSFFHTFSVDGNAQDTEPGKRVTEVSFAYHVPGVRHSVIVYTEAMSWDNPVQGHFTERFALAPGVYLPHVPYAKKLDLRLEGAYTALPGIPQSGYFYANAHYSQGYTNYGQLLGSWIGRQGRGGTATSTYWFSSRTKTTGTYRRMVADQRMIQGGNLSDYSLSFSWLLNPRIEISTVQQYERWRFPVINEGSKSNFSTTFQLQWFKRPRL
jgi:hypothetical protein